MHVCRLGIDQDLRLNFPFRSRQPQNEEVPIPRRRRRRSITKESASPARSPNVNVQAPIKNVEHDADQEDNEADDGREDSPEHIYHQIGTSEVIRVSKNKKGGHRSSLGEAKAFKAQSGPSIESCSAPDQIIITKNTASRKPRLSSKGILCYMIIEQDLYL